MLMRGGGAPARGRSGAPCRPVGAHPAPSLPGVGGADLAAEAGYFDQAPVPRGGILRPHARIPGALTDSYKTRPRPPAMLAVHETHHSRNHGEGHRSCQGLLHPPSRGQGRVRRRLVRRAAHRRPGGPRGFIRDTAPRPGHARPARHPGRSTSRSTTWTPCTTRRATGAVFEGPPSDKPWGDRSFTLTDPHGVRVRVYVVSPRPMSPEFATYVKEWRDARAPR